MNDIKYVHPIKSVSNATPLQITGSFEPLKEFGHITQQAIMPIISIVDGEILPLGTCFAIHPNGYLITAKHVIESFSKSPVRHLKGNGYYKEFSLWVFQLTGHKHNSGPNKGEFVGGLRPLTKAWFSAELDIAICTLSPPDNQEHNELLELPCVKLSPGLPKIGENILGFGYYKSSGEVTSETQDGHTVVNYSQNTAFTRGKIIEIFSPKRDSGMLSYPCFQTEARFNHGMSGGPIFKEDGSVCGVICSSVSGNEDEDYTSFASLIWPAFGTSIEVKRKKDDKPELKTLYELAKRKFIKVDETIDQIELITNSNGTRTIKINNA